MDLQLFLLYIHHGAYECSQQLFTNYLEIKDLKNLRLVSRAFNDIVLEYPVLTKLNISSHKADLDYLNLVAKNSKLVQHVQALIWDHSLHELLLLDDESLFVTWAFYSMMQHRRIIPQESKEETISRTVPSIEVWENLARAQKSILENDSDYEAVENLLPKIPNVTSVIFTNQEFQKLETFITPSPTPAMREWQAIPEELRRRMPPPCTVKWSKEFNCYFSDVSEWCTPHLILEISQSSKPEHGFWRRYPVRGLKFFKDLALQRVEREKTRQEEPSSSDRVFNATGTTMRMFFPKLKKLAVTNIQPEFITPQDGGEELIFFRRSVAQLQHLQFTLPRTKKYNGDEEQRLYRALVSNILPAASTLQVLHIGDMAKPYESIANSVFTVSKIMPQLKALKYLLMSGGSTTPTDLQLLASNIRLCASMEYLYLCTMLLSRGRWKDVLEMWKRSGALNHLRSIRIEAIRIERIAIGARVSGFTRSIGPRDSVVRWLRGEQDEYPLLAES